MKSAETLGIIRKCAHCGSEFLQYHGNSKYCSTGCRSSSYDNKKIVKKCDHCAKEFLGRNAGKYCSPKCANEVQHISRARSKKCQKCGNLFQPGIGPEERRRRYCCDACKPKNLANCAHCGGGMPDFIKGIPMMYCSSTCKHDAAQLRHSLKYKKYKKSGRERLAKALRMFRSGSSTHEIAAALGRKHTSLSCFLLQSKAYKKITDKRKKASNWYAKESSINAISVEFRLESHFNNHAMGKLKSLFPVVRREVRVPGSKRRIDIVVEHGLFRFGIELKNGNRTARLDQTLGQAIVKCNAMGGLIPVCVVPDDVTPDMVFINGCKSVGAIAGRLSDVMEEMRIRCCA